MSGVDIFGIRYTIDYGQNNTAAHRIPDRPVKELTKVLNSKEGLKKIYNMCVFGKLMNNDTL